MVVTCQFFAANLSLYTLMYSSASHSYVDNRVVDKLEWNKESFTYLSITVTPARDVYESMTRSKMFHSILEHEPYTQT